MEPIKNEGISSHDPLADPEQVPVLNRPDPEDQSVRNLVETQSEPAPEESVDSEHPITEDKKKVVESEDDKDAGSKMPLVVKKKKKRRNSTNHGSIVGTPIFFFP